MLIANETTAIKSATDNNVVLNDKAAQAAPSDNALTLLTELEQQRISWEEGVYRTSNQMLYSILSQCLQFGGNLDTTEAHKTRRSALKSFYEQRGYRWKEDTPLMTKIVRAVFGDRDLDRRRISTYSVVLRQASKEGVLPTRFAEWVDQNGGVQAIKLLQSSTFVTPKAKAERAQGSFEQMDKLAVVKTDELSKLADPDNIGENCLLVATQEADGTFTVRALVTANAAVNAAFAAIYQAEITARAEEEKVLKAALEAELKAALLKKAA